MRVKKAETKEEFAEVFRLVLDVPNREHLTVQAPSAAKILSKCRDWIESHGAFIVVDDSEKVRGLMILCYDEPWWDVTGFLTNAVMYVEPEYRSSKLYKRLLQEGHKYGKIVGYEFLPSFSFVENLERRIKIMKRLGYEPESVVFRKQTEKTKREKD